MQISPSRILLVALLLTAMLVGTLAAVALLDREQSTQVLIGGGPQGGEAQAAVRAIADMARRYDPSIEVVVVETGGSAENLRLLREGLVDAAALSANAGTTPDMRLVTTLYEDSYQLVVREEAGIDGIADLRGRTIALPGETSAQAHTFRTLAAHYGLASGDYTVVPMSESATEFALAQDAVDATFRVRAPGNAVMRRLIAQGGLRLLPIDQAAALRLTDSAVHPGKIPRGSYRGTPALPERDLETVVVPRLLVTNDEVNADVVEHITALIYDHRRELTEELALLGFMSDPEDVLSNTLPVHEGARRVFMRDAPTFLQENVEILAFYATLLAGVVSLLFQLSGRRQKARADEYNRTIVTIYNDAVDDPDPDMATYRNRMMEVFASVVRDSEAGLLSSNGFEFLQFVWDEVNDATAEMVATKRERGGRKSTQQARTEPPRGRGGAAA